MKLVKVDLVVTDESFHIPIDTYFEENEQLCKVWMENVGIKDGQIKLDKLPLDKLVMLVSGLPISERARVWKLWRTILFPIYSVDEKEKVLLLSQYAQFHLRQVGFVEYEGKTYPLKRFMTHEEIILTLTPKMVISGWTVSFPNQHVLLTEEEHAAIKEAIDFSSTVEEAMKKLGKRSGLSETEMDEVIKETAETLRGKPEGNE